MTSPNPILRPQTNWENLYFYQKSNSLYVITYYFTQHFLQRGDRTIDQMIQAARSGKQNIVEGSADAVTSAKMQIHLLNVARASHKELREDYIDFLRVRNLKLWTEDMPQYRALIEFCRDRNRPEEYEPILPQRSAEEIANLAITLTHMTGKMMQHYQNRLAEQFAIAGGSISSASNGRYERHFPNRENIDELRAQIRQLNLIIAEQEKYIQQLKKQAGLA